MNDQKLRTIIVDDEESGRQTLKNFISKYCSEIEIVAEADGVVSGIGQIILQTPDLVFLDIRMHDGSGFDLLEKLPSRSFSVIFVTSHDNFAIQAFRFAAVDYLLKPVDPDQLVDAVRRVKIASPQNEIESKLDVLVTNATKLEKIALPSMEGIRFVKINEILRCESDDNYTSIFMRGGERIVVSKTLKEYEQLLSGMQFCRVHKSHLVNLQWVEKYIPGEGGYLILEDGTHVDVSRRKKEWVMERLMKF